MKKFLALVAWVFSLFLGFISSSFADVYTMSWSHKAGLGQASTDTANSLVWVLSDLLPLMIPLIVVGFIIAFVRSFISKRG